MLGLARLEMERNKLKAEIMDKQRKVDLITEFVRKHSKCSLDYSDLFMGWVEDSDFCYDDIISEIGVDKWLS